MHKTLRHLLALSLLCVLITACASMASGINASPSPVKKAQTFVAPYPTTTANDRCPANISFVVSCQTPQSMRAAYGIAPLIQKGDTGQGQTVVDIVSFCSPTLQQDMDVYDKQFGLPPITVQQINPLHDPIYDPRHDRSGWADETTLDV